MMTVENVTPILRPNPEAMLQHLEHLFGGFLDGRHHGKLEIAWTDSGDHKLRHARLFGTDQFEEAIACAIAANSVQGQNVYVGAELRHPDTAPFGRCKDPDAWAATAIWADLDEEGAADLAKGRYRGCPPTLVVVTGRFPATRAQFWWRLDEPTDDLAAVRGLCEAMVPAFNADPTVVNSSRVMRLAGSIAWPVKPGRKLELTELVTFADRKPYPLGQIAKAFPPPAGALLERAEAAPPSDVRAPAQAAAAPAPAQTAAPVRSAVTGLISPTAALAKIRAGEQWHNHMIQLVGHWVARGWTDAEILGQAAGITLPGYTLVDTTREMRQALDGARRKLARPNIEAEFDPETGEAKGAHDAGPPIMAQAFAPRAIVPRPWLYGRRYLRGYVTVTIAPPGVGKSTFTIHEAISIATGNEWAGSRPVGGAQNVWIWNNEDDADELDRRIIAAAASMGVKPEDLVGRVYRNSGADTHLTIARQMPDGSVARTPNADAIVEQAKALGIALLVIDPWAEMHEVDENSNNAVKIAGGIVREIAQRAAMAVSIVHHTRKAPAGSAEAHIGNMDSGRGAGALNGVARVVHTLYGMTEKDAETLGVTEKERYRFIRLDDAKSNLSLITGNASWFKREEVDLGNGTGFRESDKVGVLVPTIIEKTPAAQAERERDLAAVAETIRDHGTNNAISTQKLAAQLELIGFRNRKKNAIRNWLMEAIPAAPADVLVSVNGAVEKLWRVSEPGRGGMQTTWKRRGANE